MTRNDSKSETLRYLIAEGMIFVPEDLGYSSGAQLVASNLFGVAAGIDAQLRRVGNRTGIEDDEEHLTANPIWVISLRATDVIPAAVVFEPSASSK